MLIPKPCVAMVQSDTATTPPSPRPRPSKASMQYQQRRQHQNNISMASAASEANGCYSTHHLYLAAEIEHCMLKKDYPSPNHACFAAPARMCRMLIPPLQIRHCHTVSFLISTTSSAAVLMYTGLVFFFFK